MDTEMDESGGATHGSTLAEPPAKGNGAINKLPRLSRILHGFGTKRGIRRGALASTPREWDDPA
jgi:hypothetical protein